MTDSALGVDVTSGHRWIGKSIKRVEDPKFLRGLGEYVANLSLPDMLHASVLRSPHAHARIVSIDVEAARRLAGVVAVVTGPEAAELVDPLPDFSPDPTKHVWRVLAEDKVRHVGEGVAVIVAENRYVAEDACDLIDVEYESLDAIADPSAAAEGAPFVHEALESNIVYEREFVFGDVEKDFAEADHVIHDLLRWRRDAANPLDTAASVAVWNAGSAEMTIHTNSAMWTSFQFALAATLKLPSNRLNLVSHPAGGSFGAKYFCWKSMAIPAMMSKVTGPVKYVEDRLDHMYNGDKHGSDRYYDVALAVSADGRFRSLRTDVLDDYGAYLSLGVATHGNALAQVTGAYKIPSTSYRVRAVLTNKVQQGAYRGFGAEVASWVIERLVDKAARELDIDPVEIRRRNFIQPDEFPHHIATGNLYDSGNYTAALDQALERFGYEEWLAERDRMRAEGRHVGVGVVTTVERSVYSSTEFWFWFDEPPIQITSSPEGVTIEVDALGNLVVTLYASPFWGNSSDTMAAMLVAEEFGVDPAAVTVRHHRGSQGGLPASGPGGSRLTVMMAGAVRGAAMKVKDKARRIAAHLMEASADDLEWSDGGFAVRGASDQRRSLTEVAMASHLFAQTLPEGTETGLVENYVYEHPYTTMPAADRSDLGVFYPCMGNACHVVGVEVDPATGTVHVLKYVAVHDSGTIVNPRSLAGQVIGGTVQGLATALSEELAFDAQGDPLTPTLWDFGMPTAMDVPEVIVGHEQTPSPLTEHGIKGGGEAGRLVAPAAVSAAIDDALSDMGVRITELPATPERIFRQLSDNSAPAS